ncbi:uncharacterized protein [Asterias amurensis]|uniref:uncharacterized protein n=1 Tax=Asterias amurensis TaxID=7602 RepID=UPI003AB7BC21
MANLLEAIEKQNAAFGKFFGANDLDGLKSLYTEDCRMMPQGADTLIGNHVVPKVMGGMRDMGATSCQLITDEVGPLGGSDDTVYERGHYIFGKADGSELAVGKYVVIWKKTSEGYKMHIDIFNDNKA